MIREIVKDYREISANIDRLIKLSGYKIGYIQKQMGIDNASFYYKRKKAKFTVDEIERLLDVINIGGCLYKIDKEKHFAIQNPQPWLILRFFFFFSYAFSFFIYLLEATPNIETLEDKVLGEMSLEAEKENETLSRKETKEILNWN